MCAVNLQRLFCSQNMVFNDSFNAFLYTNKRITNQLRSILRETQQQQCFHVDFVNNLLTYRNE